MMGHATAGWSSANSTHVNPPRPPARGEREQVGRYSAWPWRGAELPAARGSRGRRGRRVAAEVVGSRLVRSNVSPVGIVSTVGMLLPSGVRDC